MSFAVDLFAISSIRYTPVDAITATAKMIVIRATYEIVIALLAANHSLPVISGGPVVNIMLFACIICGGGGATVYHITFG